MLKKIAVIILLFITLPYSFIYAEHTKEHKIEELLEKISSLQNQISILQSNFVQCEFTKNLSIGAQGSMVLCLQNYLTNLGHFAYSLGSTGYFGVITRDSVISWQKANNISSTGFFGPISRFKYDELTRKKSVVDDSILKNIIESVNGIGNLKNQIINIHILSDRINILGNELNNMKNVPELDDQLKDMQSKIGNINSLNILANKSSSLGGEIKAALNLSNSYYYNYDTNTYYNERKEMLIKLGIQLTETGAVQDELLRLGNSGNKLENIGIPLFDQTLNIGIFGKHISDNLKNIGQEMEIKGSDLTNLKISQNSENAKIETNIEVQIDNFKNLGVDFKNLGRQMTDISNLETFSVQTNDLRIFGNELNNLTAISNELGYLSSQGAGLENKDEQAIMEIGNRLISLGDRITALEQKLTSQIKRLGDLISLGDRLGSMENLDSRFKNYGDKIKENASGIGNLDNLKDLEFNIASATLNNLNNLGILSYNFIKEIDDFENQIAILENVEILNTFIDNIISLGITGVKIGNETIDLKNAINSL
ncbi:MAG: peptidoglycan-binding domain-containing protein [Patescibacteria group bacterium]